MSVFKSMIVALSTIVAASVYSASVSAANLTYPGDCKDNILRKAATKNGCQLESGAKHHKVIKNGETVTLIPNSVKQNATCRSIIKALNASC